MSPDSPTRRIRPILNRSSRFVLFAAVAAAACSDPQPTVGSLIVNVSGLPTGALASVRITGPNQFFQLVRATETLESLEPGEYVIRRDTVLFSNTLYGVADWRDTVTITRGRSESTAAPYQLASGSITLNVFGLPSNVASQVRVRGPLPGSTYDETHAVATTINGLRAGDYEIRADSMSSFLGDRFLGAPVTQIVSVVPSVTPIAVNVAYLVTSGTLAINVNGLPPSNTIQSITVTGPNSYLYRTANSITLRGLEQGTYNVAASNISGTCPNVYNTTDLNQSAPVAVGGTSEVTVTYAISAASDGDLNLKIDKVYLTQATQRSDGSVPIITGRPALVRVFGSANQCNTVKPRVRITTSTGFTAEIDAGEDSVRVLPDESRLASTWNAIIPTDMIATGMTLFAEMDITNVAVEANETDNRFPANGSFPIDVRTGPVVGVRLVPIHQSSLATTGTADVSLMMDWPRKLHPVATYDVDVRSSVFTTAGPLQQCTSTATGLTAQGACPSWSSVLAEVDALRVPDGSNRYYYGVARVNYNSGVAGIAYVPGKAGIGWDYTSANTNQNSASRVMAHELGHNYLRRHSPCGNPGGIDSSYPYSGGVIGAHGWDPNEGFKMGANFTDIMGYCNSQWISDYTYVGMLDWITDPARAPTLPSIGSTAEQPSLLVWGRIENGDIVLEPAFEISARPQHVEPGPHRLAALDENGAELFAVSFAGNEIADLPGNSENFAFTVPVAALRGRTLGSLKLTARGLTVTNVASSHVSADPAVTVSRVNARVARLRWDATRFPVVMVRDPSTGHVLSFARGGDATVVTSQTQLDLNFSNRLRSSRRLREFK